MNKFSDKTIEELGYYVYSLTDPRNNKIFYIGKGCGNRVFNHSKAALHENDESLKLNLIRDIISSGAEVEHFILRHKLTKEEALKIESVLIDFLTYPKFNTEQVLTNIVSGHHQWDEGIKTVDEISSIYDCEKIKVNPSERLLLVSLNYKIPCSGVISRPAASTSCRSFFITSAGIHLRSTLTVRTRLRLRTMSIGA